MLTVRVVKAYMLLNYLHKNVPVIAAVKFTSWATTNTMKVLITYKLSIMNS